MAQQLSGQTKPGHCRDVPIDLSHLCSVGFAASRLKWTGVVLTRVVHTRNPFPNAINFHCRIRKFPKANESLTEQARASNSFIVLISWYIYLSFVSKSIRLNNYGQ